MTDLRIAIAGAGLIGRAHQRRIQQHGSGCRLVAFADPSPSATEVVRAADVPLYADLHSMVAHERPDGVILATPNALHVPGAVACLEAGIPVLVEKPVATSVADAMALVRAERRSGVPVLVGHHRRHSAFLEGAKVLIDSGQLGRLVAISCTALFHKPDSYFVDGPWRARVGGGPILINLVHEVDCMRALAGDITSLQAFSSNARRGFEVEDTAAITMRFANGALGTFIVSDTAAAPNSWEQTTGEDPVFARYQGQNCYLIAGDRGSLQVPTMRHFSYSGERSWNVPMRRDEPSVPEVDPLARQLAHFCEVIRGAPPSVSALEATKKLQVVELVSAAVRTGQQQAVEELAAE